VMISPMYNARNVFGASGASPRMLNGYQGVAASANAGRSPFGKRSSRVEQMGKAFRQ